MLRHTISIILPLQVSRHAALQNLSLWLVVPLLSYKILPVRSSRITTPFLGYLDTNTLSVLLSTLVSVLDS